MKTLLKLAAYILLTGALVYVSCKKERSCEGCIGNNKPPKVIAGLDRVITLPNDSVSLDGSASSDPDGIISSYFWSKISGPASFNINKPSDSITRVKALVVGTYLFELKVTDNGGLSAKDTMQVVLIDPSQPNQPPVANAGADQLIILPVNIVSLNGNGSTDPDNNITNYVWTKISGPISFNVVNGNGVQTQVTNLVQGIYQFELRVTDAGGLFSKDTMQLVVNDATSVCAQLVSIGTLSISREYVCAATAGNKILFAGGATQLSPTVVASSRVDIYDMISQNWSTSELSIPRLALVSVTLGNKIYFTDGFYNASSRVDIYDASTNTWSKSELSTARAGLASGSTSSKVVFAGGYSPYSDKIDILDASTNSWSTAILNEPRTEISVTSFGSKIYFSGGLTNRGPDISNKVDVYDATTNGWSEIIMTESKWGHVSIGAGNKIFWAGGSSTFDANGDALSNSSVEIFDINNGSRTYHQLSISPFNGAIMNNKIIFLPVISYYSNGGLAFNVEVYDINTQTWSVCSVSSPLPTHIGWRQAIIGAGNKIYMSEGLGGSNLPKVWKLEF